MLPLCCAVVDCSCLAAYQLYAGLIWGLVMYLFHFQKGTLQPSMASSMTYLYLDSNTWPSVDMSIVDWLIK